MHGITAWTTRIKSDAGDRAIDLTEFGDSRLGSDVRWLEWWREKFSGERLH